ncbi:MAG: hypothetical protein SFX74_12790 [Fimbriimonadaceae bacterium]|nr:hypothetical protein [Fimbriimonadaceae bacterium]
MTPPDSAVDRWLLREGWYFAGWTVNRSMVRGHAPMGMGIAMVGALIAPIAGWLMEPSMAMLGLPLIIGGGTVSIMAHYIANNPRIPHAPGPKLSDRAHRFMRQLVADCAPLQVTDPHYNSRKVRQSPARLKRSATEFLHPQALAAFESLCAAYNRAVAATIDSTDVTEDARTALRKVMAEGLDAVAALQEYPESPEPQTTQLRRLVEKLNEFSTLIEQRLVQVPHDLSPSLGAWIEALRQDEEESLPERA